LVEYPPTVQLSKLVNSLKGVSSRRLRSKISYALIGTNCCLSYLAASRGGAPLDIIRRYVESQRTPA
jgi:putative transposase